MFRTLIAGAMTTVLISCSPTLENQGAEQPELDVKNNSIAFKSELTPSFIAQADLQTEAAITESDLHKRVEFLADDQFKGRAPGTPEGEASADILAVQMAAMGLEPGNNGSWFQEVGMVATTVDLETSHLTLNINGEARELQAGNEAVYWTKRQVTDTISFDNSDMIFVGYGVVAPEYGWNDYEGIDVTGKTVVMLINDPGFATQDPDLFNGNAMTYYGRWTYKFEEAARQGADAAIIVHETAPAAYGWNVVSGSWMGEQADLKRNANGMDRIPMEAWITHDVASELFDAAGLDFEALKQAATKTGFTPVPMTGLSAAGQINQSVRTDTSRNVAGMVRGSIRPDEYVIYTAHWDHLGEKLNFVEEDNIHNGAVDNATGTSLMMEMAEKFASGEPPERSVLFLAVTLEESGLLGSAYFAANPFVPLNKIVAGINMDGMMPRSAAESMVVIGSGASELEDLLKPILASQDRIPAPDPAAEKGYFYRSDHVSLAKVGVPMLYAESGPDLRVGGIEAGIKSEADYLVNRYHKPADEYEPEWSFASMVEDGLVFYQLGHQIADSELWPTWYEGNEFKAIRDASLEN